MAYYRALAKQRARQRQIKARCPDLNTLAVNYRYWRKTYRRASMSICRMPLA